ncbi:MAG TPA: YdaS family helix-turn-helix protein [Bradyrhizobium sp.]|jgi:hypothetical protein|nr:YdaS family helix-turn-helix protein [Bradyrhizobium sp.]
MSDLPAKYHFHELKRLLGDYKLKVYMPCFHCWEPEAAEILFAFAKFGGAAHEQLPSGTLPKMDALFAPDPEPENLFMLRDYVLSGDTIVAAAIKAAGGIRLLARKLGIRPHAIEQWKCIPTEQLQAIARITGLPQHVLRPDLFDVSEPQFYCTEEEADEIWKWSHAWQLWLPLPYPPGFLPACCCARRPRLTLVVDRGAA